MPINYNNSKIYKIYSKTSPDIFMYGITTTTLPRRLADLKSKYKKSPTTPRPENKVLIHGDPVIQFIKNSPATNRDEMNAMLGEFIRNQQQSASQGMIFDTLNEFDLKYGANSDGIHISDINLTIPLESQYQSAKHLLAYLIKQRPEVSDLIIQSITKLV